MKTIRILLSGIAVYFLVAVLHACGGSGSQASHGGASGAGGRGSTATAGGGMGGIMDPVGDADAKSGTRLKVRAWVGSDGSRQSYGFGLFYDSERNEDCSFSSALDGVLRCIPVEKSLAQYYADDLCSQPLAFVGKGPCGKAPTYVVSIGATCSQQWKIYAAGPQYVPGANVYSVSGSSCVASPAIPSFDYYSAGTEIQPSAFVDGSIVTEP